MNSNNKIVISDMPDELNETATFFVSQPCEKQGCVYAFVSVEWNGMTAEFKIPDIALIRNAGFNEEQIGNLENYIRNNMPNDKGDRPLYLRVKGTDPCLLRSWNDTGRFVELTG